MLDAKSILFLALGELWHDLFDCVRLWGLWGHLTSSRHQLQNYSNMMKMNGEDDESSTPLVVYLFFAVRNELELETIIYHVSTIRFHLSGRSTNLLRACGTKYVVEQQPPYIVSLRWQVLLLCSPNGSSVYVCVQVKRIDWTWNVTEQSAYDD